MLRASSTVCNGNSMGYSCWGVVLTTHFLLVPGCKWVGALSLPTVCAGMGWPLSLLCQRWCISVADGVGHDLTCIGDPPLHPTHRNSSHNLVLVRWCWLWSLISRDPYFWLLIMCWHKQCKPLLSNSSQDMYRGQDKHAGKFIYSIILMHNFTHLHVRGYLCHGFPGQSVLYGF